MLLGGVMPVETETFKGGAKTAIPDASSATASTLPPQGYNQKHWLAPPLTMMIIMRSRGQ